MSVEVINKFQVKMFALYEKFADIENKVSTKHDQIDAVIQQIEDIQMLTKNFLSFPVVILKELDQIE